MGAMGLEEHGARSHGCAERAVHGGHGGTGGKTEGGSGRRDPLKSAERAMRPWGQEPWVHRGHGGRGAWGQGGALWLKGAMGG